MTLSALIHLVIAIVIVGIVVGVLHWIVKTAPFIAEPIRSYVAWGVLAIGALIACGVLLRFAGLA